MKRIYVNVITFGLISVFAYLIQNSKAQTFIEYTCSPNGERPNYAEHDLSSDGIDLRHISFLSFQVKCPCNAYILLQKDRGNFDNDVVEIVLGAYQNTYSLMRDKTDREMDTLYKEEGIVCNTAFRHFWVSWDNENGTVRVGKGDTEFINGFMTWSGLNHKLNYVSVGNGYDTGYWKFKHDSTISKMTTENSLGVMAANTLSTDKALPVFTIEAEEGANITTDFTNNKQNNTSSFDSANETNDMTAIFVSVPIVVVLIIGITVVAVLVLKRNRKKKEQGKTLRKGIPQSKENIQQNSGIANKAFVNHSKKEDSGAQVSNIAEVSNQYAEIAEDNRKSVNPIYENSNVQPKLNHVLDGGYGEFMNKKMNTVEEETIYQNTLNETKVPVTNLYSNLDNNNSLLYLNVKKLSAGSNYKDKNSVANYADNDSYYDHARAGGHEWDVKDKDWNSDDNGRQKAIPNNEKIYENTVFEKQNQATTSEQSEEEYGEACSNIPFYLELEEEHRYINQDSELIELEGDEQPEIDYASCIRHDITANKKTKPQVNDSYIKANIYDRHYFILEKENAMQEENTVYEGNLSHEYFILEKVDK